MYKSEVIERFCDLASKVGKKAFANSKAHDCFCDESKDNNPSNFQFEDDVLRFIETAVQMQLDKLERDRRAREND